jgi:multicomponent Na+:H+ antiporter subunit C
VILVLALCVGALYACGAYLMLQRTLTRIVMGLALTGHGANLLLLMAGGRAGEAPLIGGDHAGAAVEGGAGTRAAEGATTFADPLPQAMALTAIVITFGIMAFLLALAYRSWTLTHDDQTEDDLEDRRIAAMARQDHEIPELTGVGEMIDDDETGSG